MAAASAAAAVAMVMMTLPMTRLRGANESLMRIYRCRRRLDGAIHLYTFIDTSRHRMTQQLLLAMHDAANFLDI